MEGDSLDKVIVHLKPVANAPILKKNKFKVPAQENFSMIINFVSSQIKAKDGVFLYCNSAFSPCPDSKIFDLFKSFKVGNELIVNYAVTEAWG